MQINKEKEILVALLSKLKYSSKETDIVDLIREEIEIHQNHGIELIYLDENKKKDEIEVNNMGFIECITIYNDTNIYDVCIKLVDNLPKEKAKIK